MPQEGNVDTENAQITVLAAENSDPEIVEPSSPRTTVDENTTATVTVGSYTATDVDDDELTFTLGGADAAQFSIESDTTGGDLTFAPPTPTGTPPTGGLDYETKTSYEVTITVSDGQGGTDAEVTVTVTIINVDEGGTVTFSPTSVRAGGTVMASVTDPDAPGGITGVITWSWSGIAGTNPGNSSSYTTVAADATNELTATVTYHDAAEDMTLIRQMPRLQC